jgi:hypothetical protein
MIAIQDDVWRAECIAGFGLAEDAENENWEIQLFPINTVDSVDYTYDNYDVMIKEYKKVIAAWKREIECGR